MFFRIVFGAVTEGAEFAFMVLKILQSYYIQSYNLFRGKRIEKHFIRDILITTHLVNVKCTYSKV